MIVVNLPRQRERLDKVDCVTTGDQFEYLHSNGWCHAKSKEKKKKKVRKNERTYRRQLVVRERRESKKMRL